MKLKKLSALLLAGAMCVSIAACSGGTSSTPAPAETGTTETTPAETGAASDLNVAVFYYNYSDAFISNVRNEMDAQWEAMGVTYVNYDGKTKRMGRNEGKTAAFKKAIVQLKADSKPIEFFESLT